MVFYKRKNMSFQLFTSTTECVEASCVATDLLEDLVDGSSFNLRLAEALGKALKAEKARTALLQEEVTFLRKVVLARPEPRDNLRTVTCKFWASPGGCGAGDVCSFMHDVREKWSK